MYVATLDKPVAIASGYSLIVLLFIKKLYVTVQRFNDLIMYIPMYYKEAHHNNVHHHLCSPVNQMSYQPVIVQIATVDIAM